jgi:drug/metabolite transporter (DMT)-like permease
MPVASKGILYASITALLWSVLAIVMKVSLTNLSPSDITWFRFCMAFSVLFIYYLVKQPGALAILQKPPRTLILATLCLAANYYGFIEGVNLTSPSVAQIFIQLGPVLLAVAGFILFRERISWRQTGGLFMVLAGLSIFYYDQLHHALLRKLDLQTGIVWIIIAAITWAAYSILLKRLVTRYHPMELNLVVFGLPVILYAPFVHFSHFLGIGTMGWLILLFMGMNTLVAYGLLSLALKHLEANRISVILILNPILTFVFMACIALAGAQWIQHEKFTMVTLLGALTVLAGAILSVFRKNPTAK